MRRVPSGRTTSRALALNVKPNVRLQGWHIRLTFMGHLLVTHYREMGSRRTRLVREVNHKYASRSIEEPGYMKHLDLISC